MWIKFLLQVCLNSSAAADYRLSLATYFPFFFHTELPLDVLSFVPSCLPTDRSKKKRKKTLLALPRTHSNCGAVSSSYSCPLTEGLTSQTRCLLPLMSYLAVAAQSSQGLEGAPELLPIDKSLA